MDQVPCPLQASEGWRPEAWLVAAQRRELCQLSSWHGEAKQRAGVDPDPEEGGDGGLVWDEPDEKEMQAMAVQPCLVRIRREEKKEKEHLEDMTLPHLSLQLCGGVCR